MKNIEIIHSPTKSEPFIVAVKPRALPTAPLKNGEDCALFRISRDFPSVLFVRGKKEIEGGLCHRLDTQTEGLFLCALEQDFFDKIQIEQSEGRFFKTYRARVEKNPQNATNLGGFPPFLNDFCECAILESRFRPFGKNGKVVRPVTALSGKASEKKAGKSLYRTNVKIKNDKAVCKISAGYRHQVRCHLAWSGFPIFGDALYNFNFFEKNEEMDFTACALDFLGFHFEI